MYMIAEDKMIRILPQYIFRIIVGINLDTFPNFKIFSKNL